VSQGYFQPDVGGKTIPVAEGELSDLAGDEPLFKALYKWWAGGVDRFDRFDRGGGSAGPTGTAGRDRSAAPAAARRMGRRMLRGPPRPASAEARCV
jgi:hypothetical protein